MKKALIYGLSAALLLASMSACGKPDADQQTTESEPPQIQATIPEAETIPEQKPEETPAVPEPISEDVPVESDETEDNQTPEETEGMGVIDPDNTPADVYSSDGLTEQEQEELQQRFQEEVHVDETLPEITQEMINDEDEAAMRELLASRGHLNLDTTGKDYSPESTSKGYTEGWTEKYN